MADQTSPLAAFLHQLSHATYESPDSATKSRCDAQVEAEAQVHSPDAQNGPTPFQDFMKYLTQATYNSPGAKAGRAPAASTSRWASESCDAAAVKCTDPALNMVAAKALGSPGILTQSSPTSWWLLCDPDTHLACTICTVKAEVTYLPTPAAVLQHLSVTKNPWQGDDKFQLAVVCGNQIMCLELGGCPADVVVCAVRLGEEGLAAWLHHSQASHAIRTPARTQLQVRPLMLTPWLHRPATLSCSSFLCT